MAGQVFCVFYALFGVPLNLAFLNQLGKGLNAHLITLERWVQKPGHDQEVVQLLVWISLSVFTSFWNTAIILPSISENQYAIFIYDSFIVICFFPRDSQFAFLNADSAELLSKHSLNFEQGL